MPWGAASPPPSAGALGAGDEARAQSLALHATVIGAVVGSAFSALFVAFGPGIFRALGGHGPVLEHALTYSSVALAGAVLIWLLNTLASIVRGTGNMRVPSLTILGAAALQIGLGGALGLGIGPIPRFGLAGVACGMVTGSAAGALFLLWFLSSGQARVTLRFRGVRLARDMFFDILKVGALAAFSPLQTVLTVLVLTALVARFGIEALAGYGIGARLEFLLVPITFAVGVASVPMVGMAIGARDVARARRVAWTAAGFATLLLGGIGLTVAIAPDIWSARFTQDAGVRAAADLYLRLAGPAFAFVGTGMALYFASQGSGKVLGPVLARDRPAGGDRGRRLVPDRERGAGVDAVRPGGAVDAGLRADDGGCGLHHAVGTRPEPLSRRFFSRQTV